MAGPFLTLPPESKGVVQLLLTWLDTDRIAPLNAPAILCGSLKYSLRITTREASILRIEVADQVFQSISVDVFRPVVAKSQTVFIPCEAEGERVFIHHIGSVEFGGGEDSNGDLSVSMEVDALMILSRLDVDGDGFGARIIDGI